MAVVIVVVLATTGVWNPWPGVWAKIMASEPIVASGAAWQQRLGGSADSVTVAGDAVIVESRTRTEAFGLQAGVQLWEKDANWSAVAGGGDDSVVVIGKLLTRGYQVLHPVSGYPLRTDTEAMAVWTFADAILDVRCGGDECHLSAWEPRGTTPLWTTPSPGLGFVLFADNPGLPGLRPLSAARVDENAGGPRRMPPLISFSSDGKLHLLDTAAGTVVRVLEPERDQRVTAAGGRTLTVTARAADGTCYFTVTATEPGSGRAVWQREGLNLRTSDDAGCEHRHEPSGSQDVVLGVTPTGREVLVDVHDGRTLWQGGKGERVVAVNDRYALVRAADGKSVAARDFSRERSTWKRETTAKAQLALTSHAVVLVDENPRRIVALRPATGAVLAEIRTSAQVRAVGRGGLVLAEGREIAYVPFASAPA